MRALMALLVLMLALPLAACGFKPMYAQDGPRKQLSGISVDVPDSRTGFLIEQELNKKLNVDPQLTPAYRLTVRATERSFALGYRLDDTASRSELTSNVVYILRDARSNQILLRGNFTETMSYATGSTPFVDIVGQQDAQKRLAEAISVRIESDLMQYFLSPK